MRDLSLHILDLVENAVEADARAVRISITENLKEDVLEIKVADDGRGMDETLLEKVLDPFVTTRNTRRVGLGLPLLEMTTRQADGHLRVSSHPGKGTEVIARYRHSHLDRPPLGDVAETITVLMVANPTLDITYSHTVQNRNFTVCSSEISQALDDVPVNHPAVVAWLREYLKGRLSILYGGEPDENN